MAANRVETLFRDHAADVLAYALRRADAATAEDVVAEVFSIAWRRTDRIPDSEPLVWLYAVARRVLANQRRSVRRRVAFESAMRPLVDDRTSPDRDDEFASAMRGLSSADREVLRLAAWEGLDGDQIAVILGCSTNAAYTRLHRAKRRLAARLDRSPDAKSRQTPKVACDE